MRLSRFFSLLCIALLLTTTFVPWGQPVSALDETFVVDSLGDEEDASLDGTCATSGGVCTLRAAIMEANANADQNTIQFDLTGAGPYEILPASPLPMILNPVILDATTQTGCTTPCISLSGSALPPETDAGLALHTNDSTLKGFIITSFPACGLDVVGDRNTIQANYVGYLPGSAIRLPNSNGICVLGSDNLIGGTSAGQRNIASGNTNSGILVGCCEDIPSTGNLIKGNYIGTDETGNIGWPNVIGILVDDPVVDTLIGGTEAGARNVFGAFSQSAIDVHGTGTVIQGNLIGIGANGTTALGGGDHGIRIRPGAWNSTIGGNTNAAKNKIANFALAGIRVETGAKGYHSMLRNSIFSNGMLGIDLGVEGVTVNDDLDADTGPNGLQNFPYIVSATSATKVIITVLRSKANQTYRIEFFKSPSCDPSGKGEGKNYLGARLATTDAAGYVRIKFTSSVSFPVGNGIIATATDSTGRTSEFGNCRLAE